MELQPTYCQNLQQLPSCRRHQGRCPAQLGSEHLGPMEVQLYCCRHQTVQRKQENHFLWLESDKESPLQEFGCCSAIRKKNDESNMKIKHHNESFLKIYRKLCVDIQVL